MGGVGMEFTFSVPISYSQVLTGYPTILNKYEKLNLIHVPDRFEYPCSPSSY
ncbi:hypothetical protein MTR_5g030200 [Medicago truncatula]|uniref:Uncharacterized protein n=1 Tax=Medicago truncatula TaxID=3880 RepID=G7KDT3_MEDTR|nr:hypothetical protein MTR_5g030200 [Medicago truncatula]